MPFTFRKTKSLEKGLKVTASKSGLSASTKVGRISVSTRGNASVRLGKGLSFRTKLW
ncbi:DUF4236 domain-containing protein [Kineococcus gynurae]|uniref:DUF4236 domain-containing protein n=1 Tax=Kineococcus gynurae TaxID=452979 RepID=A0ABV5LX05_9ACTN